MTLNDPGNVAEAPSVNRWLPVIGGVMMNMALGTFYANSAFLPPLEKEFGWTRAQTSLVTTFGIVMIASWFVVGGRLNDRKGPRITGLIGGILFSLGFLMASHLQGVASALHIPTLGGFYLTVGVCVA